MRDDCKKKKDTIEENKANKFFLQPIHHDYMLYIIYNTQYP